MALRACEGKCGGSYEDDGQQPPPMPEGETALFLCLGCALSYAVWCKENGHEDALPMPVPGGKPATAEMPQQYGAASRPPCAGTTDDNEPCGLGAGHPGQCWPKEVERRG